MGHSLKLVFPSAAGQSAGAHVLFLRLHLSAALTLPAPDFSSLHRHSAGLFCRFFLSIILLHYIPPHSLILHHLSVTTFLISILHFLYFHPVLAEGGKWPPTAALMEACVCACMCVCAQGCNPL